MKVTRFSRSPTIAIVSIIFIYIILILLVLLFSDLLLQDVVKGGSLMNRVVIPIGILLPTVLFGIVILNVVRLFRDRRRNTPGVKFKTRLLLFFAFVTFLASIPQAILSISFIDTTLNSWFSARIGSSLQGGVHIALTDYNERVNNLRSFSNSRIFISTLRDLEYRPQRVWENINTVNPLIDSVQIFKDDGTVLTIGNPVGSVDAYESELTLRDMVIKETTEAVTALRYHTEVEIGGRQYQIIVSSFLPSNFDAEAGQLTQSLEVFRQLEEFNAFFRIVLILFYAFFSFPILLISILVTFLLSDEIIRPIVHLEEATKKVADGDFSIRILSRSKDELSVLTQSFNSMVSELERSRKKLLQTEKVVAWQEIAQRLAHEIKNPLTPIRLSAERILKRYKSDKTGLDSILEPAVASIVREVDTLTSLLQEFRDFARLPAPDIHPEPLYPIIEHMVENFKVSYPGIAFYYTHIDQTVKVLADRGQISRVFYNLCKNAIDAMDREGEITMQTDLVTKGSFYYCRIQLQDTGPGIDVPHQDKVFNPYFTTKESGTGLGLAIVERIVFDHKGQIWFETEKGVGTTFYIDIPAEKQE
jgi:two-component system, NtrC family, nitrogen regulation sensor histidine kinase NtrY